MTDIEKPEIILRGIGASPGICIGKAYLVDREGVNVIPQYHLSEDHVEAEKNRFRTAVEKAKEDLKAVIAESSLQENTTILETHIVMLKDKMVYDKTLDCIEKEHVNAEWALKKVITALLANFKRISDFYLRERGEDVTHVSNRILRNLVGVEYNHIRSINKRVILVAEDLSPAETSQINLEKIMGFVTDGGGMTSHTAIIARNFQIPAVLGLDNATSLIDNDDLIVVDGTTGELILHPSEETLVRFVQRSLRYDAQRAAMAKSCQFPANTLDGIHIQVFGNIEFPEEVVAVKDNGGDGIGLYRSEFQYLKRSSFPDEHELFDKYRDVVEVMNPAPVTIRTLDINGDKAIVQTTHSSEKNPALGLRAIRYCLQKPEVFKTQLRAILRAAAFGNVRIMFPMISGVEEIIQARHALDQAAESLDKEDIPFNQDIDVGMMIEVPSAAMMADMMAKHVDFFSIGTNDLIQYSLAIDRGSRHVNYLYQPLHPAILRLIRQISDAAEHQGIRISMCGEMAGDPTYTPLLLGFGIRELSMNPLAVPLVKSMIRSVNVKETHELVRQAMKLGTAAEVAALLKDTYGNIVTDKLYGR